MKQIRIFWGHLARHLSTSKIISSHLLCILRCFMLFLPIRHFDRSNLFQLPEILERNMFWINMLAYMHAMINPVIYITLNEKFRQEFAKAVLFGKTASTESGLIMLPKVTRIRNSSNYSYTPRWLKKKYTNAQADSLCPLGPRVWESLICLQNFAIFEAEKGDLIVHC